MSVTIVGRNPLNVCLIHFQINDIYISIHINQGWVAGAGCFWLLGAGAARKKSGAGPAKKLAGSSALREDKKHKEIDL